MGLIAEQFPAQPTPETEPETKTADMGALTPIHAIKLKVKPPPKPEPYRPANAGRLALRPDRNIIRHLMLQCLDEGITLTRWFEREALNYLKKHAPKENNVGAQAPQTNKLLKKKNKGTLFIRTIYEFWTAAYNLSREHPDRRSRPLWNDRDETRAQEIGETPPEVQELGILYSLLRIHDKQRPILSFAYYVPEIRAQHLEWQQSDPALITVRLLDLRFKAARAFRVAVPQPTAEQRKVAAKTGAPVPPPISRT